MRSYVELKSSSLFLPYIPLSFTSLSAILPSIPYLTLPFVPLPYLPYLLLIFPFYLPSLVLPCSFPVPSFVPYIPLSLSTFLIPSQPSPFPLNLPFSLSIFLFPSQPFPSLLFLFPTYLFPYLSPSLSSIYLLLSLLLPTVLLPNPSFFSAVTFPLFLNFFLPFFLSFFPSLFPLFFLSPLPSFYIPFAFPFFPFSPLFLPLFLPFFLPFPSSWIFDFIHPWHSFYQICYEAVRGALTFLTHFFCCIISFWENYLRKTC